MKLTVDKVTENSDGTVTVNFEMDDEYEEFIKKSLGVEVLTDEMVHSFVNSAVEKMVLEKTKELESQNPPEK